MDNRYYNTTGKKKPYGKKPLTGKQKFLFAFVVIIYTLLLSTISYYMLARPDVGDSKILYGVDSDGNRVSQNVTPDEGKYNILLMGRDKEANLTDVIMLINVDDINHTVKIIQIPRDTYVAGEDNVGSNSHKINELFADYSLTYGKDDETTLGMVKTELEKTLCVNINEAMLLDLQGFKNIVDALGGVEIDIPDDMVYDDPEQGLYINLKAGHTVLNGEDAEGFVRFRHGYVQGDLGRVNAQKLFLSALFRSFKNNVSLSNISDIAAAALDNLTTDMSVSDMVLYGRILLKCDLGSIKMRTLPGNTTASHYVICKSAALDAINEDLNTYKEGKISSELFDANKFFVDLDDTDAVDIYYGSEIFDENVYDGDNIGDDVVIPMM